MNTYMIRTYDFDGRSHIMSEEEFDSIEQSGKCSLFDYVSGKWWKTKPVHGAIKCMNKRPGKTAPGLSPAQGFTRSTGRQTPSRSMVPGSMFHLNTRGASGQVPACGLNANKADVFGFQLFSRIRNDERICPGCLVVFGLEIESGVGRRFKREHQNLRKAA